MQNYKSSIKANSNRTSNEENVHGYIPRKCDFRCYKCRYQAKCVIPRRLTEARKRFIGNNVLGNMTPLNNKYRRNVFLPILGYRKRLLRYLLINHKKKKLYNKDSE